MSKEKLGIIISGSFVDGVVAKLSYGLDLSTVAIGRFVCIKDGNDVFLSIISNLSLGSVPESVIQNPPHEDEKLFSHILNKTVLHIIAHLKPMITVHKDGKFEPVNTVPRHLSGIFQANESDVAAVFGQEDEGFKNFSIGHPIGMNANVCLNLGHFTTRSNGIFGKTGTGKTFITRTILAGITRSKCAVNLVFDMHSEYGIQARSEGKKCSFVKGLKTLFPGDVAIFSLDPEATRKRGCSPDVSVQLSYRDIRVQDVILLQDELNLHSTALEAAYLLGNRFGNKWLETLLDSGENLRELSENVGAHPESIGALYRKLKRFEHFKFLQKAPSKPPVVDMMLEYLNRGISVVLEFGRQTSMLSYLLIAGIITRRIHRAYVAKTEHFLSTQNSSDEPRKLVITIEEAHKFLNPKAARQTIFGMIAREMRKYYVSLLVVDQRPSCIDNEVLSQLGTKIVAQLSDESDIQAVLTGVSGASSVKAILATLGPKKQAFVMGHAVPMPVVIQTREYDEKFYSAVSTNATAAVKELFG
ncbi:ATP-binding protein [Candidatus Dependentiae bacterium]